MAFRLSKDHIDWFVGIKKDYKINFDLYYFCFILGIASNSKGEEDGVDMIDHFPQDYRSVSNLILGLLISAEAKNMGINITERKNATKHLDIFIDPAEPSKLSSEGQRTANLYADGGCKLLRQKLEKPYYLGEFISRYRGIFMNEIKNNKNFN